MKRILVAFSDRHPALSPQRLRGDPNHHHAVKQLFGGSQSPDDARIAAVAKAKREALGWRELISKAQPS